MPNLEKKALDLAYQKAVKVLRRCVRKIGFYASGLPGGYEALWARDSMITALGASRVGKKFKAPIARSLKTLSRHQSRLGQIPNAVGTYNTDRKSDITYNTIDSTLWYLIGHYVYAKTFKDKSLSRGHKINISKAFAWLRYQDPNEDKLPVQLPTMDWQDAFPHKYGRVLNTQALYFATLKMYGQKKLSRRIQRVVNGDIEKYLSLYRPDLGYYLPWAWKNHDGEREEEQWFDTLGNLLAIVTGLATPKIAKSVLRHIDRKKINRPYPCKALWPPITKGSKDWHSYFEKAESRKPLHYLNAGIWPFIGGFYVAALVKTKQYKKAERELELLARANLEGGAFHEWLHGKTGKPVGGSNPYQAWSAGMYIFAYECLKRRKNPYFD